MERFYLKSFGCKVNQYDGQGLRDRLIHNGFTETKAPEEADLMVLNFCVVTSRSASRCFRALNSAAKRKPSARVLVAGCLTPEDRDRVRKSLPEAAFLADDAPMDWVQALQPEKDQWDAISGLQGRTRAFVKVQDGCNLRCSYCIIPSIRGDERSRPVDQILEEAASLLEGGYKELVICGIRLGGYRGLPQLLQRILKLGDQAFRIRLSSLNPAEVTEPLLELMASDSRVANHLHLPLQSGDPGVLKRMKRPYSPKLYLRKVEKIRTFLDHPALSTDLIVGFPGESEAAFEASLDLLKRAGVSRVHVFPFSIRKGAEAAKFPMLPDSVRTERARIARREAAGLKETFDQGFIGTWARVLVESSKGQAQGLTSRYQKVRINGHATLNEFVKVRLDSLEDGVFGGTHP